MVVMNEVSMCVRLLAVGNDHHCSRRLAKHASFPITGMSNVLPCGISIYFSCTLRVHIIHTWYSMLRPIDGIKLQYRWNSSLL